jgi:hypothetical protein
VTSIGRPTPPSRLPGQAMAKAMKAEANPASTKPHKTSEDYTASPQHYIDQ